MMLLRIIVLNLIFITIIAQNTITFQAASPASAGSPTFTVYYTGLYGSDRTISLKGMDYLLLIVNPAVNNIITTQFNSVVYSTIDSSPKNSTFTMKGTWKIVKATNESISCTLVLQTSTNTYGLVQVVNNSMMMIYQSNTTLTASNVANLQLKEKCFAYDGPNLYKVTQTGLLTVQTPPNWNILSSPQNIDYIVTGDALYRQNTDFSFTSIYNFTSNMAYDIKSYQGRILVVAANASVVNSISQISQKFYVFQDNSSLSLLGHFSIIGKNLANFLLIPYISSPKLTKIGAFYTTVDTSASSIIMRSVDYNKKNTVTEVIVPSRILNNIASVPVGNINFYVLTQRFLTVRNTSGYKNSAPSMKPNVEIYEFFADQCLYLQNFTLANAQDLNDSYIKSISFDDNPTKFGILSYYNISTGYKLTNLSFHKKLNSYRISFPTAERYLVNFTSLSGASPPNKKDSIWGYSSYTAASNISKSTVFIFNTGFPLNLQILNSTFSGNQYIRAVNRQCMILYNAVTKEFIFAILQNGFSNSSNVTVTYDNISLTTPINSAGISVDSTSVWTLSDSCERFTANNNLFYKSSTQTTFTLMSFPSTPTAFDLDLTIALVGNQVWLLDNATNIFKFFYTIPDTISALTDKNISIYTNRLVVAAFNKTYAQVLAYSINSSGALINCLNFSSPNYTGSFTNIVFSPQLTKIIIVGQNATTMLSAINAYHINYAANTNQTIYFTIPFSFFLHNMAVDDQYFYIRSKDTSNQMVFYINKDLSTQSLYHYAFSYSYEKSYFVYLPGGGLNLYIQQKSSGCYIKKIQLSLSKLRDNLLQYSSIVKDEVTSIGMLGCLAYQQRYCFYSAQTWQKDINFYSCNKCATNCAVCDIKNYKVCSSCLVGSYLSLSSCLPCDKSCLSCTNASSCASCFPYQTIVNGKCVQLCPSSCISCVNSTYCNTCSKGFIAANGKCRGCGISCSSCNPNNITQCTSCSSGLVLINSVCVSCINKCQSCVDNSSCIICIPGYFPNDSGICVLACSIRCATCVENQPNTCLSCWGNNTYLLNGQCFLNTSCNTDSSCLNCGQVLGYYLVKANCYPCYQIDNCLQCSLLQQQNCTLCTNGYYVNTDYQCSPCPANCVTCQSQQVCTVCPIGYTFPQKYDKGQCIKCKPPCLSCLGISNYCLSCIDGFTKIGWKCQNNTFVDFKITLVDPPSSILTNIDNITYYLLSILAEDTTQTYIVTYVAIFQGSTVLQGYITPTVLDNSVAASTLSTSLANGLLGNYTIVSSSLTVFGNTSSSSSSGSSSNNSTLIDLQILIGLLVGFFIILTVSLIFMLASCCKKKRSKVHPQKHKNRVSIMVQQLHQMTLQRNSSNLASDKILMRRL